MCSKFIVIRFAPGSGGKFIATLLQLSPDVNSWDQQLENIKQQKNSRLYLDYIRSKFTDDFVAWLKTEPEVPYETKWVSNRFDRGDDITHEQALEFLRHDRLFQDHYYNDKRIVLISNKSRVPDWLPKNTTIINVLIDSIWAMKWVHRARLHKQFIQIEPGCWIIKQDHPDYCSEKRADLAKQFSNPTEFRGTSFQFLKKNIVKDPLIKKFQEQHEILDDASNDHHCQIFWELSCLQNIEKIKRTLEKTYKDCGLTAPGDDILLPIIEYYLGLHNQLSKQNAC